MKRAFVRALIRLYPSRWRAEYGEELAEVLLRRPLGLGAAANVALHAVRQQARMQAPWLITGVPLTVWMVAVMVMLLASADSAIRMGGRPTFGGVALFFGVGGWTMWRSGGGAGRAAMKLSVLVTAPAFLVGIAMLCRSVEARPHWSNTDTLLIFVLGPILQIPYAGFIGWCGGLAVRLARRIRERVS